MRLHAQTAGYSIPTMARGSIAFIFSFMKSRLRSTDSKFAANTGVSHNFAGGTLSAIWGVKGQWSEVTHVIY